MKIKYTYVTTAVMIGACIILPALAAAKNDDGPNDHGNSVAALQMQSQTQEQEREHQSATSSITDDEQDSATSTDNHENEDQATSTVETENDDHGKGEEHRSKVATIVHELLSAADRAGGIGQELRVVAEQQATTSEEAAGAIDKLDSEGGFKKFILGPDFKSLGQLRSTIVTTQNDIQRLTRARDRATSSTVKAALDSQISALEDVASSTQAYVQSHENTFSLLGWFIRLFQ